MVKGLSKICRAAGAVKDNKGAGLVFVIMTMGVILIFAAIISTLFQGNLLQAKAQENDMRAYYLSTSGTDLVLAALLKEGPGGETDTLLYEHFNETIAAPTELTDTLELDEGDVVVTVRAITDIPSGDRWIEIVSVGTLDEPVVTKTTTLQFQYSNPLVQSRS